MLDQLRAALVPAEDTDTREVEKMKVDMLKDLDGRFENTDEYEVATILDPTVKGWMCKKRGTT